MKTEHNETVIDKAVGYVKDMFGIHPEAAPDVEAKPEFHDTEPEVTAENAMRLDPDAYLVDPAGQITPGLLNTSGDTTPASYVASTDESDAERLRREVDEPREKSAIESGSEIVRRENGI
jgi:hypothetical protein